MKGIDGIHSIKGMDYGKEPAKADGREENILILPREDLLEVSREYEEDIMEAPLEPEWKTFFEGLRKQFKDVTFYMGDCLSDCASAERDGVSVVISHRFMEKILYGGEEGTEYRERLVHALTRFCEDSHGKKGTGIFIDTEQAVCWKFTEEKEELREPYQKLNRVSDMLKEFELSHTRNQERQKKNRQKMLTGGVSNLYAMAAMTKDKPSVFSVVAKANRQISSLKMAAAGAKGAEAAKINAVVNSLRKLIAKCNSKLRKIDKAEQAEAEYKRALKRKTEKKVEECRRELNRRRRILRCENEGIKNAGILEDWKNSSNFKLMDEMERLQAAYQAAGGSEIEMSGENGSDSAAGAASGGSIAVTEIIPF